MIPGEPSGYINEPPSIADYLWTRRISAIKTLESVRTECIGQMALLHPEQQQTQYDLQNLLLHVVLNLQGSTAHPLTLSDVEFDADACVQNWIDRGFTNGQVLYSLYRMQLFYLYGQWTAGWAIAQATKPLLVLIADQMAEAEFALYAGLIAAALYPEATSVEQLQYWETLQESQATLQVWADDYPDQFSYAALLMAAEMARFSQQNWEALELYDRAIAAAQTHQLLYGQALANEVAAWFWFGKQKPHLAEPYLTRAYDYYTQWGANAKVGDLERQYAQGLVAVNRSDAQTLPQPVADRTQPLHNSQLLFRSVFEQAAVGLEYTNSEGRFLLVNQTFCNLLGYTREELSALRFQDITHPEDLHQNEVYFQQLLAGDVDHYTYEKRFLRKDGSWVWVHLTVSLLYSSSYEHPLVLAVVQDISDRKAAQSQLQIQNELLQQIATGRSLSTVLLDLVRTIEAHIVGCRCSVLLLDQEGRLHCGAAPSLPDSYNRAIDGLAIGPAVACCGTAVHRKAIVIVPDIATSPLWNGYHDLALAHNLRACWSAPFSSSDGQVLGTFAIYYSTPTTPTSDQIQFLEMAASLTGIAVERYQATEALRLSEERLRLTLEFTQIGAWQWQPTTGQYNWSGQMLQLLELPEGLDNMFQVWRDRVHPDDQERVDHLISTAIAAGTDFSADYRYHLSNGTWVWRQFKGRPVYNAAGELQTVLGVVLDINEQKQVEATIRASEVQLQRANTDMHAIFSAFPDLFFRLDAQGMFLDYRAGKQQPDLYAPPAVFMGRRMQDVLPAPMGQELYEAMQQSLQINDMVSVEYALPYGEEWKDYEARFVPVSSDQVVVTIRNITKQKAAQRDRDRAEASLRASEERYIKLTQLVPVGLFRHNTLGQLVYVNDRWCEMAGMTAEAAMGEGWLQVLAPDDRERVLQEWAEVFSQQISYQSEGRFIRPDGTQIWLYCQASPEYDAEGQLIGYVGSLTDITDRKRAEQALQDLNDQLESRVLERTQELLRSQSLLQEQEQFLRSIYEGVSHPIFVLDVLDAGNFRQVGLNPAAEQVMGSRISDVQGKLTTDLFPSALATKFLADFQRCVEAGKRISYEEQINFQGQDFWMLTTLNPLFNSNGKIYRLVGTALDITARRLAEVALSESETKFRNLVENLNDLIYATDDQGAFTYLSPQFTELFGYDPKDFLGRTPLDLTHPDDIPIVVANMQRVMTTGERVRSEVRTFHKDGSIRWVTTNDVPIRDEQGTIVGFQGSVRNTTEQKLAEAQLQQNEARLQATFNQAAVGIVEAAVHGPLLKLNQKFCEIVGYSEAELLQKTFIEITHPDDVAIDQYHTQRLLRGEATTFLLEKRYLRKDQSPVWASLAVSLIRDAAGNPAYFVGIILDISDRIEAETALRNSQAMLAEAQRVAHIGSWDYDLRSGRITWTDEQYRMFDLDPTQPEPTYEQLGALLHPEDWLKLQQSVERAITTGEPYKLLLRVPQPDSSMHYVQGIGKAECNASGQVVRLYGTTQDVTEQELIKQALAQRNMILRSVIESTPDVIFVKDLQTRIVIVNSSFAAFFNQPVEALLGKDDTELWPPDMVQHIRTIDSRIMTTGISETFEELVPHADGILRTYLTTKSPWYDGQGNVIGLIGLARDISDRKQAEAALLQMNLELEDRVEARTAELKEAKEVAEAANQAKSAFLANMSHELRTPLNAILGFAQLLARDSSLAPDQRQQLGIINRSGEHLLSLINDILEMSKIEAGRMIFNPISFDLHALLHTLQDMFRLRALEKGLQLTVECAADVPRSIQTDESKLRQVLINLLGNAVKFTRVGGVTLRVEVGRGEAGIEERGAGSGDWGLGIDSEADILGSPLLSSPPQSLILQVSDTGPGIDPGELEALFEPFVQSRNRQVVQEGTGLGLPISREFVRLMGGELTVNSMPAQGSVFTVTIPIVVAASDLPMTAPTPQVAGLAPGQPCYRILVVEDNETNRQLLVQLLKLVGFAVRFAVNGEDAIALWETWHPHLIWMDIRMPGMDGLETTRRIRVQERASGSDPLSHPPTLLPASPPTKIIALTANAFAEEQTKVLAAGCDDFISKPFQETVLLEKISQHLGVKYVYLEVSSAIANQKPETLSVSASELLAQLQEMPVSWLIQLYQAAIHLNGEQVTELLDALPPERSRLQAALKKKLDEFDFEPIMTLVQQVLAP